MPDNFKDLKDKLDDMRQEKTRTAGCSGTIAIDPAASRYSNYYYTSYVYTPSKKDHGKDACIK